jgi:hypothetical protein
MDVQYEIEGYPSTDDILAMQEAVFNPLTRNMPVQTGFKNDLLELIERWRARTVELFGAGWDRIQGGSFQLSRDCPPSFAYVSPQGLQPCRLYKICPFCWARSVREVFIQMNEAAYCLQNGVRRFDLLEGQHEIASLPFAGPHAATPETVVAEAQRSRPGLAGRDVLGGHVSTIIQPPRNPAGENPQWQVVHRVLILVPPGSLKTTDFRQTLQRFPNPSTRKIALAVARTCSYPTGLMHSNIAPTVALLKAMTDARMSNHHGYFFGNWTNYLTHDDGSDES